MVLLLRQNAGLITINFALSVTCTWQIFLLTHDWRVQRPIAWIRWGKNVVLPVISARPTLSVSRFVRLGSCTVANARLTLNVGWQFVSTKLHTRYNLRCQQTLGYQQIPKHNEDGHIFHNAVIRRYELLLLYFERQLMVVRSIIVILSYSWFNACFYCNSLYHDFTFKSITKLQCVHNCLARIVTRSPCFICCMRLLKSLHCLPIRYLIIFKFIGYSDEKGCLASIISLWSSFCPKSQYHCWVKCFCLFKQTRVWKTKLWSLC